MSGRAQASGPAPPRHKKQNHANIPCPIENCARFTYGKLPDHLTKRHGLTGAERDAVNEQQRKRFFNGELCQVRFLKETAIRELWGADYDDPRLRAKIHDAYAMVKIRIIPLAASARARPLTEQDANLLTNYNARTDPARRRPQQRHLAPPAKRRRSCEWSDDGEENASGRARSPPATPPSPRPSLPPTPPPSAHCSPAPIDFLDADIDDGYKFAIADMKRHMGATRDSPPRERKLCRTYRRYARRLIAFLQRQHSPLAYDVDVLLSSEPDVADFLERVRARFKARTVHHYAAATVTLLESRVAVLRADPAAADRVAALSRLCRALAARLSAVQHESAPHLLPPTSPYT